MEILVAYFRFRLHFWQNCPTLDLANDSLRWSVGASNAENGAIQIFAHSENPHKSIKSAKAPLRPCRRIFY